MPVKAQLATKIGAIIKRRKLTHIQAVELLGIPRPKLSNRLCGQFRGISETIADRRNPPQKRMSRVAVRCLISPLNP